MPILPIADPARLPDVKDFNTDHSHKAGHKKYIGMSKRDPQRPPKWIKGDDGWYYKNPEYVKYIVSLATPSRRRPKTSK